MFNLAKHCVAQQSGLKVVILTRLPRYDLPDVDPKQIKNKLSQYGNNVLTNLWMKNGCPNNIIIADQNLGCYGELRIKRFGDDQDALYDGIHMTGTLARQHYTNSVLRIFQDLHPSLKGKPLPKLTKPYQQNNRWSRPSRHVNNQPLGRSSPDYPSRQYYNGTRQSSTPYKNKHDEHTDCPQNRYQHRNRAAMVYPGEGFTIPTQNRYNPFYNYQGNF